MEERANRNKLLSLGHGQINLSVAAMIFYFVLFGDHIQPYSGVTFDSASVITPGGDPEPYRIMETELNSAMCKANTLHYSDITQTPRPLV